MSRSRGFKRDSKPISYHVQSSIWSGIKSYIPAAIEGTSWVIGYGKKVNFWTDVWMDESISDLMNIPSSLNLKATVADFIINGSWSFPSFMHEKFPDIVRIVQQMIIPLNPSEDKPVWKKSETSILTFKEAYLRFKSCMDSCSWG